MLALAGLEDLALAFVPILDDDDDDDDALGLCGAGNREPARSSATPFDVDVSRNAAFPECKALRKQHQRPYDHTYTSQPHHLYFKPLFAIAIQHHTSLHLLFCKAIIVLAQLVQVQAVWIVALHISQEKVAILGCSKRSPVIAATRPQTRQWAQNCRTKPQIGTVCPPYRNILPSR